MPYAEEFRSINPSTGELIKRFELDSDEALEGKLKLAATTFQSWRWTSFSERSQWMLRAAEILESEKQELGRIMTLEMGKTLRSAVQEAEKCARGCRYYADHAETMLADEPAETSAPGSAWRDTAGRGGTVAARSFVYYQPLGPVLAIMPWNFPFWQVFRFAAPALMAGNTALLKHAPNVPQCALAIVDLLGRAGFPAGVFQALMIDTARVERVIGDARAAAVTLTGSVRAGSSVAAMAGRNIKKVVLELGGSDPFIVMPSADFERALSTAVQARTVNNGQSCIAAKRFLVHESLYSKFERRFVERMAALTVGDPMDAGVDIGPLARPDLLDTLEAQVDRTVQMGGRLLLGGKRLGRAGNFYPPTVLCDIPEGSPARREELFGPAASLYRVKTPEEAIALANETRFGLAASCWTNDTRERELFTRQVEAGAVFVNAMVASDPRAPFGGIKQSGHGRELGIQGIREFVNVKTVVVS